jgi:alpha-pyrone synthase
MVPAMAHLPATAHLNAIGVAVPPHDVHHAFMDHVRTKITGERRRALFARMAERSGIARRFSVLAHDRPPAEGGEVFYAPDRFPGTAERMRRFAHEAPRLAAAAVDDLARREGPGWQDGVTHLIVTCCTGFAAPGIELDLVERFGLARTVERTLIGFMGCNAAFNALKHARHVVRSDPGARVLIIALELCSLHFHDTGTMEQILCFMLFADGCAAALVSAAPRGLALDRFHSTLLPASAGDITWHIGDDGFDMHLSGRVPGLIGRSLPAEMPAILGPVPRTAVDLWAVHPGGRSILDAVEDTLTLPPDALAVSRGVLHDHGNMSSATILFVLERMMRAPPAGRTGVAMGFGPGLSVEALTFREVG